ncbi:hypothetical protein VOLCADRAFT_105452 [Volvox carteri f. nagariensis]|uniref:GH16 domain-containing protein n=1 Tax=Volvox carteri f. nagariensis TaxID=3068 RepID=D8U0W2_VOLCA|nr:uncharacterized protein VOLCADRAFT_105452 [Volvox carteri f. nagariensis]EFJ46707.1 hypothetical protein VOLCADRAFT_105452 [Volvox carteri f. nagariensis]|eukprot:XP_002952236.1 hypothetical protein VOLCADRAFT_105452 [Volvox carteri f. nagariensis]
MAEVLVFSDEFNSKWRDFRPGKDARWQAIDLMYVNNDAAMFRSSAVKVQGGSAVITASKTSSSGPFSAPWGDQLATAKYTSGMLQGWNKFCFTGGYLEARIKLPGDDQHGGLWPAVFTLGNLGRAGYLRSTEGIWPFSYDICDDNALYKQNWTDHNGQRINRCNSTQGRGAPEIDLLEVGVWESSKPELSTSLQVAPVLPQGLHWLDNQGGVYYPTYADPTLYSVPNGWAGVNSYMQNATTFRPRPGSKLADAMSATHKLNASHFTDFYVYGLDWAPRKYIRWYINDILIYELNALALKGGTNSANESVGDRLIPVEPQYININVAMSDSFAPIHPDLQLPASMMIDYVRVYQARDEINVGCDTPEFPSQAYIDSHLSDYKIDLAGFDDFVGNSSVMGPTMEPPPPDYTAVIVAVCCSVGGALLLAGGVGWWIWRRRKRAQAKALLEATDPAAAAAAAAAAAEKRRREEEEKRLRDEATPGWRRWWVRLAVTIWRGSPGVNARHALAPPMWNVQVAPSPEAAAAAAMATPVASASVVVFQSLPPPSPQRVSVPYPSAASAAPQRLSTPTMTPQSPQRPSASYPSASAQPPVSYSSVPASPQRRLSSSSYPSVTVAPLPRMSASSVPPPSPPRPTASYSTAATAAPTAPYFSVPSSPRQPSVSYSSAPVALPQRPSTSSLPPPSPPRTAASYSSATAPPLALYPPVPPSPRGPAAWYTSTAAPPSSPPRRSQ